VPQLQQPARHTPWATSCRNPWAASSRNARATSSESALQKARIFINYDHDCPLRHHIRVQPP
jgi:hypothetical protein